MERDLLKLSNNEACEYTLGTIVEFKGTKYVVKLRRGLGQETTKIWQLVEDDSHCKDETTPSPCEASTFFLIGDSNNCGPCRSADAFLTKYVADNPKFTYVKWDYDMTIGKLKNPSNQKWMDEEESRNPKLRRYKYIPKIWVRGEFIGGGDELKKLIKC